MQSPVCFSFQIAVFSLALRKKKIKLIFNTKTVKFLALAFFSFEQKHCTNWTQTNNEQRETVFHISENTA